MTHHNTIATTSAPPFGSFWPPDDTELDRGKWEVETGAPKGVSHCDPHHRSYQPILCKSFPVSPSRSTGVEVCQILRVSISPDCMANQYITVMENLYFVSMNTWQSQRLKLCAPLHFNSRYFTCQPPPEPSLIPASMLWHSLYHQVPCCVNISEYIPYLLTNHTTQLYVTCHRLFRRHHFIVNIPPPTYTTLLQHYTTSPFISNANLMSSLTGE